MPKSPFVSSTTNGLSDRVYSELVERAKARNERVLSLHVGDTYLEPLDIARAESMRASEHPRLYNYAPVQGEPALLDAIVTHLARVGAKSVARDCVQVTSGATTGLSIVAQSILDVGDEVILPSPYWPLIRGIVSSRGAVPVEVPFFTRDFADTAALEASLEAAITPRTTALYANAIHNPTGAVLPPAVLDVFERLATKHDLWLLSDEAYEELAYVTPPAPLWSRPSLHERAIAAHSLSKSRGLAGARVGWIHGPASVMPAIRAVNTYQSYGPAKPMQLAAARALSDTTWVAHAKALYAEAAKRTADTLGLPAPHGGTFLFFDAAPYARGANDSRSVLEALADEGVILTAGRVCGRDYATWIRLCYTALPPGDVHEAALRARRVFERISAASRPRGGSSRQG
jgi:N-succinyldiaminopimelate aminotransferase